MHKTPPSIFNDVIGPVMRGPSSSHTAASVRIGRMVRQILGEKPLQVLFEFDPHGSLATTYESQGSAMGLAAGLLNWEITHPNLQDSLSVAKEEGLNLEFRIVPFPASHPNTYKVSAEGISGREMTFMVVSLGGGMIEFSTINAMDISLKGDFYESLFSFKHLSDIDEENIQKEIIRHFPSAVIDSSRNAEAVLLNLKTRKTIFLEAKKLISRQFNIDWSSEALPVLPILSQKSYNLPFSSYKEMLEFANNMDISLADLALEYESARAGISKDEVFSRMKELVLINQKGIKEGLEGTDYDDRILHHQSQLILQAEKEKSIIPSSVNKIIAYTSALMEVKSSMGVIVAAPTAGSCAVLGGAVFGAIDGLDGDSEAITKAFLAAGLIGVFIARDYTFAAEEGGCQVECGAASGMAAAGLVEIMGGNFAKATQAASMALQNLIGLVCDPVADRVEVPCLGKNILGATNALNSANMSMSGFEELIPLDQVIEAMKIVGNEMPSSVCCTGLSGLSVTPCSKKIKKVLKDRRK